MLKSCDIQVLGYCPKSWDIEVLDTGFLGILLDGNR